MMERDVPVTADELHAYVDGVLPPDRRAAVEAWLAVHPNDAAQVAEWRAQADAIRARYGAIANEPVPARFDLDRLARSRLRPANPVSQSGRTRITRTTVTAPPDR